MELLAVLPAFLLGWILVRLLSPARDAGWPEWLVEISLGFGLGAGISSSIYFLMLWAGIANRVSIASVEATLLIAGAILLFRQKREPEPRTRPGNPPWIWWLRGAAVIALCFFALDFSEGLTADPAGEYDAAAIWNVRARYLAAGSPHWRYAVSDKTGTNHPGYPLLTSGFVARTWVLIGDTRTSVPATIGLMYSVATIGLLCGALAVLGGESLGLLAMLVLLATEGFISQATVQYADVPLSFYILASGAVLAFAAARDWAPTLIVLAGFFAGLAAWTKNEGLLFLLFACIAAFWRGGFRAFKWMAIGAAPLLILTLVFKFALVEGHETMFPATMGQGLKMMADPSRWIEIIKSFARNFGEMGFLVTHPLLLMAVLAWALGFLPNQDARSRFWLLVPPLGLLAADFGIFLITMSGLTWHLSTSNNRLIAQVWPAVLLAFFLMLQPPAAAIRMEALPESADQKSDRKRKKREQARVSS